MADLENQDSLKVAARGTTSILEEVRERIMDWGTENIRNYPWRASRDPYNILIAELLLHRTRADQVKDVYINFIQKYPNFKTIAESDIRELELSLQSLGLRWRTNSLHELSKLLVRKYNGAIPMDRKALLSLPGIGEYTASAVLSFSENLPMPMLDTNTVRIIGRIFGFKIDDSSRRKLKFVNLMNELAGQRGVRELMFSMIDLGAKICKPRTPSCSVCPVCEFCKNSKSKEVKCIERETS